MKQRFDYPPANDKEDTKNSRDRRAAREAKRMTPEFIHAPEIPAAGATPGADEGASETPTAPAESGQAPAAPEKKPRRARRKAPSEAASVGRDYSRARDAYQTIAKRVAKISGKAAAKAVPAESWALPNAVLDEAGQISTHFDAIRDPLIRSKAAARTSDIRQKLEGSMEKKLVREAVDEYRKGQPAAAEAAKGVIELSPEETPIDDAAPEPAAEQPTAAAPEAIEEPAGQPDVQAAAPAAAPEAEPANPPQYNSKKKNWNLGREINQAKRRAQEFREQEKVSMFERIQEAKQEEAAYDAKGDELDTDQKLKRDRARDARWALQSKLDKAIDEKTKASSQDELEKEFWRLDASTPWDVRADLEKRMAVRLAELKSGLETDPATPEAYEENRKREVQINGLEMVHDSLARGQAERAKIEAKDKSAVKRPTTADGTEIPESIGAIRPGADIDSTPRQTPPGPDATPAEQRNWLKWLVSRAKETGGAAKENVGWWKSSEEKLVRRSDELDKKLDAIGGLESKFRWLGEQYNKLPLAAKAGIGAVFGLGGGAALAAGVSLPLALVCLAPTMAQRAAGLSSMFLKYEKAELEKIGQGDDRATQDKRKVAREAAMVKAMLYTAATTVGLSYAIKEIGDSEWMKRLFSQEQAAAPTSISTASMPPGPLESGSASSEAGVTTEGPHTAGPIGPNAPLDTGHAAPAVKIEYALNKGYEVVDQAPNGTPIYERLTPTENDDGIAADTVPDAETEPPVSTEDAPIPSSAPEPPAALETAPLPPRPEIETHALPDRGAFQNGPSAVTPTADSVLTDSDGHTVADTQGHPVHTGTYETPTVTPDTTSVINQFGETIMVREPHIYLDAAGKDLIVYGGTPAEQAEIVGKFFEDAGNKGATIIGSDAEGNYRLSFSLNAEGQLIAAPVRDGGVFGFFSKFLKAPGVEELQKLIK